MQIKIGIDFDVDAEDRFTFSSPRHSRDVEEVVDQPVYGWNCRTGSGRWMVPKIGDDNIPIPNLLFFYETGGPLGLREDKVKTRDMMKRVRAATGLSISQMQGRLNQQMRATRFKVPLAAFAWMNPHTVYVIWRHITYDFFTATVAARNLRFWIALPSRITFSAKVLDWCNEEAFDDDVVGGKDPDAEGDFILPPSNAKNGEFRRAANRVTLKEIERILGGEGGMNPPILSGDYWREQRRKLQEERERLGTD